MMVDRLLLGVTMRHRARFALTTVLQVLATATYLPQAAALAVAMAAVMTGDSSHALTAAALVALLAVLRWVLTGLQAFVAARLGAAVRVDLRDACLRGALSSDRLHSADSRDGAVAATIVGGVDGVDPYVTRYLPAVVQLLVLVPVVVTVLAVIKPAAGVVVGMTVAASVLLPLLWRRVLRGRSRNHWDSYEGLSSDLLETLRGMTTLRLFGAVAPARRRIAERSQALYDDTVRVMRASLFDTALIDLAVQSGTVAAAALAVLHSQGGSPAPEVYLLLMMSSEAFRPVRELSRQWHAGYLGVSAVEGLRTLGADGRSTRHAMGGHELDVGAEQGDRPTPRQQPRVEPIRVEGLTFGYPGAPRPVLAGLDATFTPGRVTAIVGASGAGKSTLLDLLLGHLRPDSGSIRRAGGGALDPDHIAVVTQRPVLFEATVRDNLRVGRPEADDAELMRACADAGILAEVQRMPGGLAARLAAGGANLSGGQRQRLAIARALVADRPVLLADEPTSALDPHSARAVTKTLAGAARHKIVLVIAHRDESLVGVDDVLELRDGVLRARDTIVEATA